MRFLKLCAFLKLLSAFPVLLNNPLMSLCELKVTWTWCFFSVSPSHFCLALTPFVVLTYCHKRLFLDCMCVCVCVCVCVCARVCLSFVAPPSAPGNFNKNPPPALSLEVQREILLVCFLYWKCLPCMVCYWEIEVGRKKKPLCVVLFCFFCFVFFVFPSWLLQCVCDLRPLGSRCSRCTKESMHQIMQTPTHTQPNTWTHTHTHTHLLTSCTAKLYFFN